MKKIIVAFGIAVAITTLFANCQCEDQVTLDMLNSKLAKTEMEIQKISSEMNLVSFEEDIATYIMLEDELTDLVIEKAITEIDIELLQKQSPCL